MSINYKQLQELVKEAMFVAGGINEPSAPVGVSHRMPAADFETKEQDKGDPKANELYELARQAREATEQLVEKLDEPIYDSAYEQAFKASKALRLALNDIEEAGAHPMPGQRQVASPERDQSYFAAGGRIAPNFASIGFGDMGLEEQENQQGQPTSLGSTRVTQSDQNQNMRNNLQTSRSDGIGDREQGIIDAVQKVLAFVAEKDDLIKFKGPLGQVLKLIQKSASNGDE